MTYVYICRACSDPHQPELPRYVLDRKHAYTMMKCFGCGEPMVRINTSTTERRVIAT